jgi:hypothetical protein
LEVLETGLNVFLNGFFRKIQHVRREKRFTVSLEVGFISSNHTIEPREQLLGTVVRVDKDGNTVGLGNGTDVLSTGNSTENRGFLVFVVNGLTSKESGTTVRELDDNRRLVLLGSFKSSVDGAISKNKVLMQNCIEITWAF